ncbi:hypothetical protein BJ912DRAFT_1047006 [Pholiota molesta]|nr:hypothetical protein BJ912DRAFT_1047006 [Pholiota molesta]
MTSIGSHLSSSLTISSGPQRNCILRFMTAKSPTQRFFSILRVASDVDGRLALELRIATTDGVRGRFRMGYVIANSGALWDIYSESTSNPVKCIYAPRPRR